MLTAVAAIIVFVVLVCFNIRAFSNVVDDKRRAEWGVRRTPERDLQWDAWLGGIGGLLALHIFHHKTTEEKRDFMEEYTRRTLLGLLVQAAPFAVIAAASLFFTE